MAILLLKIIASFFMVILTIGWLWVNFVGGLMAGQGKVHWGGVVFLTVIPLLGLWAMWG